ncbi:hypothetical protein B0H10DRAFT_2229274 [Mycena sp. CBHHK59/15]|nr:hypothetical protein B0H10DRAFT_2229274 [Mycena sp. CBHHK59/15]
MKLPPSSLLAFFLVFSGVNAQNSQIDYPTNGTVVRSGQNVTLTLERPRLIGPSATEGVGDVLYTGAIHADGKAQMSVSRFYLLGDAAVPTLEFLTLNVIVKV